MKRRSPAVARARATNTPSGAPTRSSLEDQGATSSAEPPRGAVASAECSAPEAPRDEDLSHVLGLLSRARGVDFTFYRKSTMRRRISRRMSAKNIDSMARYAKVLESDASEVEALFQEMLVRVTSFFRDEDVFAAVRERVAPELFRGRGEARPVRIWVPGCASGEEVYSLAMAMVEALPPGSAALPLQLFGTDISEAAIAHARAGIYSASACAELSRERLERFFVPVEGGYRIDSSIRGLCVFAHQDVTSDPPLSRLDLVSCRNLLIYLDPAAQAQLLEILHHSLEPGGFLLLGSCETATSRALAFTPVDAKHKIYIKPGAAPAAAPRSEARARDVARWSESDTLGADRATVTQRPVGQPHSGSPVGGAVASALDVTDPAAHDRDADERASTCECVQSLLAGQDAAVAQLRAANEEILASNEELRNLTEELETAQEELHSANEELVRINDELVGGNIALSRANAEVECTLASVGIPMVMVDLELRIRRFTPTAERVLHLIATDVGRPISHVRPKIDAPDLEALCRQVLATNTSHARHVRDVHGHWYSLHVRPYQSANGQVEGVVLYLSDIDSLKRALIENEGWGGYAAHIADTLRRPLVLLDGALRVTRCNAAFYRTFATEPIRTEGRFFYDLEGGRWNIGSLRHLLDEIIPSGTELRNYRVDTDRPDIGRRSLLLNGWRLERQPDGCAAIAVEIEEAPPERAGAVMG